MCSKCEDMKLTSEFERKTSSKDGYQSYCKMCGDEYVQQWKENNRDHINSQKRIRYSTIPQIRIYQSVHDRLKNNLRRGRYTRRTEQINGLTQVQFMDWLSFNFKDNMCWSNYGSFWQFDLIIPASSFDLTIEAQLLTCFNWNNIRPCLRSDNATKSDFILFDHITE